MKILLSLQLLLLLICCRKEIPTHTQSGEDNDSYAKARKFRLADIPDSAYYYYNKAKNEYIIAGDSIGTAQSLIHMAIIQTNKADFYGGIETSLEAEKYLQDHYNRLVRTNLARNYNNIAIASSFLYNYNDALKFYELTINFTDNNEDRLIYYNNIGEVLTSTGRYKQAISYLRKAIITSDSTNYARSLNNLATAEFLFYKKVPLPRYWNALAIRNNLKNQTEMNSSFSTLSDYYSSLRSDSALFYANKMLQTAMAIRNPEDQLQALQKIINLDRNNYLPHFKRFQLLNDSITISRGKAKNQFALIKSDIVKTEARNIELQAKDLLNENKLIYRNIIVGGLVLTLILGYIWYSKRRKRLQQEKELEVKNTELKYSKKVHDVVANGIYQVMTKLENHLDINRNETLDDLEYVYNRSRNISYDNFDTDDNSENFSGKIRKLMSYFKNDHLETILIGNETEVWEDVSDYKKAEVYQVLRELLINMKKHSKADRVSLRFERSFEKVKIFYSDTGIGINTTTILKNGVHNMVNRIENLGGNITFEDQTEKGLKVNFSFPAL